MCAEALSRIAILGKIMTGELCPDDALELLIGAPERSAAQTQAGDGLRAVEADELDAATMAHVQLRGRLEAKLIDIIGAEARIPTSRISPREPFERYGFDSVMALNVVRVLQLDFAELSPTVLFEYQTITALAEYLVERWHKETIQALGDPIAAASMVGGLPVPSAASEPPLSSSLEPAALEPDRTPENEIAIIGLSCRFPLADDLEAFWSNLKEGKDCITEIPSERWDQRLYFDPEKGKPGKSYSKWGGFLSDADCFDGAFFHISPREAERMDPQERLVLEEVWHALEDGALTREHLAEQTVGVYVGVMYSQYQLLEAEEAMNGNFLYLGSSYASIANHVSYFFNFGGPSIALDTMCSSSLTAIHLACQALRSGEIHVAVAGGVNLTIHPNKHVDLSQGRFASSDGRCRSFGVDGDGYVPGEGVGIVILKPLSAAVAAGDRIYAVIRGSSLNHGGKTNGYSIPNPKAQSRVIAQALTQARVTPRQISCIEAHGTGTSLGDPIEIAALTGAFREHTLDSQFCSVGSAKSNIGHLESAAGVAGLAKIVLQMRHRQLVPSLHADTLNPHINFADTPFSVQRTLQEWKQPIIPDGDAWKTCPRIAGISSFGAGGSNAHVIVEEYIEPTDHAVAQASVPAHLILLSANTEERLRVYAQVLAERLVHAGFDGMTEARYLASVAFTLQTGREALEERMALWVTSQEELVRKLQMFSERGEAEGVLRDRVRESRTDIDVLLAGDAGALFLANLIKLQDVARLARLWLQGGKIDWAQLAAVPRLRKISLPGYPFARVRHWPSTSSRASTEKSLHPLINRNVSTLREQQFTTSFNGTEFFLRDHMVAGQHLLPASAMLEMVRAAGELSGLGKFVRIKDIRWERPFIVETGQHRELSISLVPSGTSVEYILWSEPEPGSREVHGHGSIVEQSKPTETILARIDPKTLFAACSNPMDGKRCYQMFEKLGLAYGPSFQTLDLLHCGDSQAIGSLRLPTSPGQERAAFVIHPALLDGAIQTLIAFSLDLPPDVVQVPFSIESVEILSPLPDNCFVHTIARGGEGGPRRIFDITLADEGGLIVMRVRGLAVRPFRHAKELPQHGLTVETLLLRPVWRKANPSDPVVREDKFFRCILVFEDNERVSQLLQCQLERRGTDIKVLRVRAGAKFRECGGGLYELEPGNVNDYVQLLDRIWMNQNRPDAIVHAWSHPVPAADALVTPEMLDLGFYSMLALTQALLRQKPSGVVRLLYVYPGRVAGGQASFAAVGAFNRTVARENPSLVFKTLELDAGVDGASAWDEVVADRVLLELAGQSSGGEQVRYAANDRLVRYLEMVPKGPATTDARLLKQGGVYLLTGGFGGLGRIFAEFLAEQFQARLVLSGRSVLDGERTAFLRRLTQLGAQAVYVQADCEQRGDAVRLVRETKEAFGRLDGVLHLAGTLRDGFLLHKKREHAEAVLGPKVWGTYQLDDATRNEPLDFFVLFSSATAWMGTVGQGDYAFANAFMDDFVTYREAARAAGTRTGKTISIGWPLWQGGGMGVDDSTKAWIERTFGWLPLPKEEGMRIFTAALTAADAEWTVFHGHPEKILESLGTAYGAQEAAVKLQVPNPEERPAMDAPHAQALLAHLKKILAGELKMAIEELDPGLSFERLGIESVMVMNMTRELEKDFGELSKTLFFEHNTLLELSGYFLDYHGNQVAARFQAVPVPRPAATPKSRQATVSEPLVHTSRFVTRTPERYAKSATPSEEEIAIIGLSGRYPMADTLDEFWDNLSIGRNCIVEVPSDRWDHRRYFDPEKNKPGKCYSKWGGFLSDIDRFDPLFFNISPHEARLMDPQERLFLQTAWHTLEDAGYTRRELSGSRVGVFVGVMYAQYQLYGARESMQNRGFVPSSLSASVANRVSFAFDFRGPSLALDTMCSSSLTALHLACASIRNGDCSLALAGGVNLTLHPNKYLQLSQAKFASSDGKCRSFGDGGDGYVPGEGVGAVLLKPLHRAVKDGDHIYAVVQGSAINHGGRTNGYSVPTPVAQGEVIHEALERAGVDPTEIGYIEAHGTGTSLGDPIEISGLIRAFQKLGVSSPNQSCPIGSVKSNIGHLESAAGIAGVTKVLLQMKYGLLVPSIHSECLNPNINFQQSPFFVQHSLDPWRPRTVDGEVQPRIAAVSSFGAGGSNAHVVLAEYIAPAKTVEPSSPQVIILSAKTEPQLRQYASALVRHIGRQAVPVPSSAPPTYDYALTNLVAAAAEIINVDAKDIGLDDELDSLGFDRLALAKLAEWIQVNHGAEIVPQSLAECRTIRAVGARFIEQTQNTLTPCSLPDLAYTLQVGREPLEERLAVLASDIGELSKHLQGFSVGDSGIVNVYRGRATVDTALSKVLSEGEEGEAYLDAVLRRGNLAKLARLWVSGVDVNWPVLHRDGQARRVSLPTYPFAQDRYWIPEEPAEIDDGLGLELELRTRQSSNVNANGTSSGEPSRLYEPAVPVAVPSNGLPLKSAVIMEARPVWEDAKGAIVAAMAEVLEIEQSEFVLDLPHSDFGVDSVLAVEIVERINVSLGTELMPTDFFNFSTIRKLADHIAKDGTMPQRQTIPALTGKSNPATNPTAASRMVQVVSEDDDAELKQLLHRLEHREITAREAEHLMGRFPVEGLRND